MLRSWARRGRRRLHWCGGCSVDDPARDAGLAGVAPSGAPGGAAGFSRGGRDRFGRGAPRPPRCPGSRAARARRREPSNGAGAGPRSARRGRVRHLRVRGAGGGRRGRARGARRARRRGPPVIPVLERRPGLFVLVDPSRLRPPEAARLAGEAREAGAAGVMVGSSFDGTRDTHAVARAIREGVDDFPVVLFPGSAMQLTDEVDLVLLLSLVSGRNPQYLIEEHVRAVPFFERHPVPTLSTAYILIDGGRLTSVEAVSQTRPLPADKPELAAAHAMAARLIGMQAIYLDAGSGAERPVPAVVIRACRAATGDPAVPLFVGGGIRAPEQARAARAAGA